MFKKARITRLRAKSMVPKTAWIYVVAPYKYIRTRRNTKKQASRIKTIYVCFRGGVRAQWQRFLDYRFTHVFYVVRCLSISSMGQGYYKRNFLYSHINTRHLPVASIEVYLQELRKAGVLIVKVKPGSRKKSYRKSYGLGFYLITVFL